MLMDILMEALMSMDDESLDYVLESCDAEELEIIDSAMEEFNRTTGNPTSAGFRNGQGLVEELVRERNLRKQSKSNPDLKGYADDERRMTKRSIASMRADLKNQSPEYRREHNKSMLKGAIYGIKQSMKK